MRIYVAAPWGGKSKNLRAAQLLAALLQEAGYTVCSTWHSDSHRWDQQPRSHAEQDLREVDLCDVLLLDTRRGIGTGGMYAELGYARAKGKVILRLGGSWTIFDHLTDGVVSDESLVLTWLHQFGGSCL